MRAVLAAEDKFRRDATVGARKVPTAYCEEVGRMGRWVCYAAPGIIVAPEE